MNPTAVCILEPLSAGAVWTRGDAEAVASGLIQAVAGVRERSRSMVGVYGKLEGMVRSSDLEVVIQPLLGRIVVAVRQLAHPEHPAVAIEFCAILAGMCVESLLAQPAPDDLFHGAIAYGPGSLADGQLLGPVFEDALACAGRSLGALIWLAPSALAVYSAGSIASTMLGDFDVALAGGGSFATKAVRIRPDQAASAALAARAGSRQDLDAAVARMHTLRYLAWCGARS